MSQFPKKKRSENCLGDDYNADFIHPDDGLMEITGMINIEVEEMSNSADKRDLQNLRKRTTFERVRWK